MPKFDTSWMAAKKVPAPRKNVSRSQRFSLAFLAWVIIQFMPKQLFTILHKMAGSLRCRNTCVERLLNRSIRRPMITRRFLLAISPSAIVGMRASAFAPGDPWNDKKPESWSQKDVHQILTKSPWAKEVAIDFGDADGGPPGGGGPAGGGPPGGALGGGPGSMPEIRIVVRWDSALPIRLAAKNSPEGVAEYYMIFVSGLPMMGGRFRGSSEAPDPGTGTERLKDKTSLQRKGKDPIFPERVEMVRTSDQEGILFTFPRSSDPIALVDKDVTFVTAVGPLRIKARFSLKDMVYQGRLEL
jgi:hypothetical protein